MNKIRYPLTQAELSELVHYDPETGIIRWIKSISNRAPVGTIAGSYTKGSRNIHIYRTGFKAHRLAWLYMTGEWPKKGIDHINGNPDDNRWCNLREATQSQNTANTRRHCDNKIGYKGVTQDKSGVFYIRVMRRGVTYRRYGFATAEIAHQAYIALSKEIHGEFARSE